MISGLYKLKQIVLAHTFPVLLILATVIFIALNPSFIYRSPFNFIVKYTLYDGMNAFRILPESENNVLISVSEVCSRKGNTRIKHRYLETDALSETELTDISCISLVDHSLSNVYYSKNLDEAFTILSSNVSNYLIYKVWDGSSKTVDHIGTYEYPYYRSLQDTTIVFKGIKFYPYQFSSTTDLVNADEGYIISINETRMQELKQGRVVHPDSVSLYSDIASMVSQKTGVEFLETDIFEIFEFFIRNNHYSKKYDIRNARKTGFFPTRIVGEIDSNQDGFNDLLIRIHGRRWLPDIIICYDLINQQQLWQREFVNYVIDNFLVADIDQDGYEEIMFSTGSPCNEMPIDRYRIERGKTTQSYFYMLDHLGNHKMINQKQVTVKSDPGFYRFYYYYQADLNQVLLGIKSTHDKILKKLLILDLQSNQLLETDIEYYNILGLYNDPDGIVFIDLVDNTVFLSLIKNDLSIKSTSKIHSEYKYMGFYSDRFKIQGKYYFLNNQGELYNIKLEKTLITDRIIDHKHNQLLKNTLFVMEQINDDFHLSKYEFIETNQLNPLFLAVIIFESILILLYYYFRHLFFLPFVSGESSYAVLYRIFGSIYYWKIYGKISFYKFPRNISRRNKLFYNLLRELTTDYKIVYNKRSLFLQIQLFQLNTRNELYLVQRIAHDIKNQLHLINLQLTEEYFTDRSSNSSLPLVKTTIREIYKKTVMLLGFSKLFEFNIVTLDLVQLVRNLIMEYSNLPHFEQLQIDSEQEKFFVEIDESLLHIVLRNLLNNALKYTESNETINISIKIFKKYYQMIITNPGVISPSLLHSLNNGSTTSSSRGSRSGIGFQISQRIVENLGGQLSIACINDLIQVTIQLPQEVEK